MDRMGVSGTLDIGSIPIRATKIGLSKLCNQLFLTFFAKKIIV